MGREIISMRKISLNFIVCHLTLLQGWEGKKKSDNKRTIYDFLCDTEPLLSPHTFAAATKKNDFYSILLLSSFSSFRSPLFMFCCLHKMLFSLDSYLLSLLLLLPPFIILIREIFVVLRLTTKECEWETRK